MAFIPGAKNDVFISYAHVDNEGGATGERWVSDFVRRLEGGLRQRLGSPISLFFDTRSFESHSHLSDLLDNARSSAVLVVVLSPSYVNGQWTKAELDAFSAMPSAEGRIFTVERLPLDGGLDAYPEAVRSLRRTPFWYRTEDSGVIDILSPTLHQSRYFGALTDITAHMTKQLRAIRAGEPLRGNYADGFIPQSVVESAAHATPPAASLAAFTPSAPAVAGGTAGAGPAPAAIQAFVPPLASPNVRVVDDNSPPPVLLAQVTEDLDEQRDQVRRHLEQFRINVLPVQGYPQGGAEFSAAFHADMARAGLFVQLLGPVAGRRPPDLPQGYAQAQFEFAAAGGLRSMLWRRPDLDIASISAPHAALVGNPDVQAMSLEAFKSEIVRIVTMPPPKPVERREVKSNSNLIFINAIAEDASLADKLEDDFVSQGCAVVRSMTDGPAEEILADLNENIIDCNALLLVYGSAENVWVRRQLKLYTKLKPRRESGEALVLICNAPPAPKAPIGMRLPEAYEIEATNVIESEPVVQLLYGAER